jgi:Ca2+-binding EF-hand superfamily protein
MGKNLFDQQFDPYDALVELNERINRMEIAHNNLAKAFQRTEQELNTALNSLQQLQKGHLKLSELVSIAAIAKFNITESELKR